jgi:hypothetical protein
MQLIDLLFCVYCNVARGRDPARLGTRAKAPRTVEATRSFQSGVSSGAAVTSDDGAITLRNSILSTLHLLPRHRLPIRRVTRHCSHVVSNRELEPDAGRTPIACVQRSHPVRCVQRHSACHAQATRTRQSTASGAPIHCISAPDHGQRHL